MPRLPQLSLTPCAPAGSDCPGHFGHIDLAHVVINPLFVGMLTILLQCICINCHRLRLSPFYLAATLPGGLHQRVRGLRLLQRLKTISQICGRQVHCQFCQAEQPAFKQQGLAIVARLGDNTSAWVMVPAPVLFAILTQMVDMDLALPLLLSSQNARRRKERVVNPGFRLPVSSSVQRHSEPFACSTYGQQALHENPWTDATPFLRAVSGWCGACLSNLKSGQTLGFPNRQLGDSSHLLLRTASQPTIVLWCPMSCTNNMWDQNPGRTQQLHCHTHRNGAEDYLAALHHHRGASLSMCVCGTHACH